MIPGLILGTLLLLVTVVLWRRNRRLQRERFIREFSFPQGLYAKLRKRRPDFDLKDCSLVARGLRQFFLAYLNSGCNYVAMPSQAADDLWHEFILYTKAYESFCHQAFGSFLHHTPAVVLGSAKHDNAGLRRVWWHACKEENIDPHKPLRLPLLFALDTKLGISDGFHYAADCSRLSSSADGGAVHCGGSFSDSTVDGCTDGLGDGAGDGGADGGDGGGGCGGGGGD